MEIILHSPSDSEPFVFTLHDWELQPSGFLNGIRGFLDGAVWLCFDDAQAPSAAVLDQYTRIIEQARAMQASSVELYFD